MRELNNRQARHPIRRPRPRQHLTLQRLDDRCLPSATTFVQQTNLVSDQPGVAPITDPSLVNAWGIALGPTGGTLWVSDNATGQTSLFKGGVNGSPFVQNPGLTEVNGLGAPTGQVFNGTGQFKIHDAAGDTASPIFIFVSEDGTITGWNPKLPPGTGPSTQAQLAVSVPDAVFKGVTIGSDGTNNFLFATDFHNGKVDVFDSNFAPVTLGKDAFSDRKVPAGYAPFNIQNLGGNLFVTFAKQDADKHDDVAGQGHGFVDEFDVHGKLIERVAEHGPLNSPWGLAIAPDGWGKFSGDLLVGNFGDGHINAFKLDHGGDKHGEFDGALRTANDKTLVIPGLWGLQFGNGVSAGDKTTLFFTAGPDHEAHGLLGTLTPVAGKHGHDGDDDNDDVDMPGDHKSAAAAPQASVRQSHFANPVDLASVNAFLRADSGVLGGFGAATAAGHGTSRIVTGFGLDAEIGIGDLAGNTLGSLAAHGHDFLGGIFVG